MFACMSEELVERKKLYDYQEKALERIFARIHEFPANYNLCFQLPTGGGKTVIFSEIARRYIQETGKKFSFSLIELNYSVRRVTC